MYNDIANDPSNPIPGQVFNRPGGPDVYRGVHIDYEGEAVNVQVCCTALKTLGVIQRGNQAAVEAWWPAL
jgi:legumain